MLIRSDPELNEVLRALRFPGLIIFSNPISCGVATYLLMYVSFLLSPPSFPELTTAIATNIHMAPSKLILNPQTQPTQFTPGVPPTCPDEISCWIGLGRGRFMSLLREGVS
ncbi:hypothetical protein PILCRDRAFT_252415 [Piloderma croceum F 1598]|uniref:Uncharacterized protein n=1 Tax=Piloderma croceum (strain F 1598) TaxID=765440 RepID=A0A0C3BP54_PILCF|nr:hypothetical protein PILCRDRAFT_252415 [Piloderma croceum F 1598]